jgi:hypothetical protein
MTLTTWKRFLPQKRGAPGGRTCGQTNSAEAPESRSRTHVAGLRPLSEIILARPGFCHLVKIRYPSSSARSRLSLLRLPVGCLAYFGVSLRRAIASAMRSSFMCPSKLLLASELRSVHRCVARLNIDELQRVGSREPPGIEAVVVRPLAMTFSVLSEEMAITQQNTFCD